MVTMLLDSIQFLDRQVSRLDDAIAACLDKIPAARGADADGAVLPPGRVP